MGLIIIILRTTNNDVDELNNYTMLNFLISHLTDQKQNHLYYFITILFKEVEYEV